MKTSSIEVKGLEVEYEWWPSCKGKRENGIPIEPDEEAGFEITKIIYKDCDVTELLCEIFDHAETIYEWTREAIEEDALDAAADKADWEYECQKDERINYGDFKLWP